MNNKIFKSKSSFYLFSVLSFLLILACVGSVFVFNASAATPDKGNGRINIIRKDAVNSNKIYWSFNTNSATIVGDSLDFKIDNSNESGTIYFYIESDHKDREFSCGVEKAKYYDNKDNELTDNYSIDKIVNNGKKDIKVGNETLLSLNEFEVTLPKVDTSGNKHHAKLDLVFDTANQKFTFNSITSNFNWVDKSEQFKLYESKEENGTLTADKTKEITDGTYTFLNNGTTTFTFFIEPTEEFKDDFDKAIIGAKYVEKYPGLTENNEQEVSFDYTVSEKEKVDSGFKVTLELFSVKKEINGDRITFEKNIESGITHDLPVNLNVSISKNIRRKITVQKGEDSKEVDLNDTNNVEVKIAVPTEKDEEPKWQDNLKLELQSDGTYKIVDTNKVSCNYNESNKSFTGKDGVVYIYDETNKKFKDTSNGNEYAYDESTKSFTGKDGIVYTYDSNSKIFSYENDNVSVPYKGSVYLFINPTKNGWYNGSDITINGDNVVLKDLNKFVDSNGNEYDYDATNKNFIGSDNVKYNLNTVFKDSNENEYDYDESTKSFIGKDGIVYTYDEANKKFKGSDKNEYTYDESTKSFTSKDGEKYNHDETNKKFKDNNNNSYDYNESTKSFTLDSVYTYDEANKKFKDNNNNLYDYNESTKSFTGKDGIVYTYDETNKKFKDSNENEYAYDESTKSFTIKKGLKYKMLCYCEIKEITDDKAVTVSGFKIHNLRFSVNFNGAPAGTDERITISVDKITEINDKNEITSKEDLDSTNNNYSGINQLGFICEITAGSNKVNWQDIDLGKLEYSFSGGIKLEESNGSNEKGIPFKKFTVTDLNDDVTLNISSVPYKTIGVCFHEAVCDENGNFTGILDKEIDDASNQKAEIYLNNSTTKVSSFSSGQAWSFDLKFTDEYESGGSLAASVCALCAYDENTESFIGKDGVVYTKNGSNFKDSDGKEYPYDGKTFTGKDDIVYTYDENNKGFIVFIKIGDSIVGIKPEDKNRDGRTYTFGVPENVRGYEKVVVAVKDIVDRRFPVQFKVKDSYVDSSANLKDFKIEYIKPDRYQKSGEMYVPTVEKVGDIYQHKDSNDDNWAELTDGFEMESAGEFLSKTTRIVPYNGILVFRITLNDTSKAKYILDDNLEIGANSKVEKTIVNPSNAKLKEDNYSCVQVVVGNGDGIKEAMTGKNGSVSIGDLETSTKEVTFKFFDKDKNELTLDNTHAGNILEKVTAYRINNETFTGLTEDKLYSTRILYQCVRNGDKVENTKNSYMLNYKKDGNVIALRTMAGIDVSEIACTITGESLADPIKIDDENKKIAVLDDNNGNIVAFKIPDSINASSPDKLVIEISGIDIMKYKITLNGFIGQVGVEKKLSSESDFKEVKTNYFEIDYGEDFEIRIIGTSKDSYEGLFNRISLGSGSALFLKEGTQSGGTALEKEADGGFKYTFFVYKVKSDSTIIFTNEINKTMLDFEDVDGMEFYECSGSKDGKDIAVLEDKKIQGKVSCAYGTKYSFAVKASTGYDLSTFKLKATVEGSEAIEEGSAEFSNMFDIDTETNGNYRIYTIVNKDKKDVTVENGVQKSTTISGSINKEVKIVNFKVPKKSDNDDSAEPVLKYLNEQGNEISSVNVEYGSNLTFSVELSERYSNSNITVELYKGNELIETLHTVSGHYKITNITESYTVQVSGCTINNYFVNFSKSDYVGYLIVENGEDKEMNDNVAVPYGSSCYFKVKEKEGYQMGENTVVQATSASGQKVTLEKNSLGQYKLTNIKDNYTITIANIDEIFYNLKFIPIDGVTYHNEVGSVITGDFKVGYGKNFEFSIKIDDAHSESIQGAYIVTNESAQSEVKIQKLASDRYLIQGITQDVTVRVANVSKNKYTVTLTKDEGIDYYNKDGKVITGENEVEYGESLSFKVNLYPLYANSNIKVMLGNQELSADDNEFYTVETVIENKTVTVVGIGKTDVAEVIETINSLPTDIKDDTDLEQIIQAVRDYNNLSDSEKSSVGNYYVLEQLQKKVADIIHTYNGVTAEGLDWNIKLIANPIDTDIDACTRIYGKLNSEYILSLYDVYLWDTLTERRYTLPEGKSVVIHLPTPNMSYFENPSGIHENSDGKLNFLTLNMGNSVTSLETSSLSPIGIVADRSIQPGRSSLIDAIDSNVSMLTNYTLGSIGGSGNKKESNYSGNKNNSSTSFDEGEALTDNSDSGTNKFRKTDNSTTRLGSALKLILIIMILLIIIAVIWALVKKYKDKSKKSQE